MSNEIEEKNILIEKKCIFKYSKTLRGNGSITMKCDSGEYSCLIKNNDTFYLNIIKDIITSIENKKQKYNIIFSEDQDGKLCRLIIDSEDEQNSLDFTLRQNKPSKCVLM